MTDFWNDCDDDLNLDGFGMYSKLGDEAVAELVEKTAKRAQKRGWGAKETSNYLRKHMDKVPYKEIRDTAVRTAIIGYLEGETGLQLSPYL